MPTKVITKNARGESGEKEIFDRGVMKMILATLDAADRITQTEDGDIEEFVAVDKAGKELVRVRENYKKGRSTIHFDGKTYTKVDRYFVDGRINHRITDAESSESMNTINEREFSELYGIMAVRSLTR